MYRAAEKLQYVTSDDLVLWFYLMQNIIKQKGMNDKVFPMFLLLLL